MKIDIHVVECKLTHGTPISRTISILLIQSCLKVFFCLSIILYQNANMSIILVEPSNVPSLLTCDTTITGRNGEKKRTTVSACNDLTDFYGNYQPVLLTFKLLAEFKVVISSSLQSAFIHESHFGVTDATVHIRKESVQGNFAPRL